MVCALFVRRIRTNSEQTGTSPFSVVRARWKTSRSSSTREYDDIATRCFLVCFSVRFNGSNPSESCFLRRVILIPPRSNVVTPTPATTEPTAPDGVVETPTGEAGGSTGESMAAIDNTTTPPASLDTEIETSPVSYRPLVRRIKFIRRRPPPGYVSSDSEGNVERLVLPDAEME
jgi:hypothetical protein